LGQQCLGGFGVSGGNEQLEQRANLPQRHPCLMYVFGVATGWNLNQAMGQDMAGSPKVMGEHRLKTMRAALGGFHDGAGFWPEQAISAQCL
jgi:hypothetical protein